MTSYLKLFLYKFNLNILLQEDYFLIHYKASNLIFTENDLLKLLVMIIKLRERYIWEILRQTSDTLQKHSETASPKASKAIEQMVL